MMTDRVPRRRVWLYVPDTDPDALEIAILGALGEIAPVIASIKSALERWPGFARVTFIGSGTTTCVLRADLTALGCYDDPLAEFNRMMIDSAAHFRTDIAWRVGDARIGIIGTW